ncbi:hypothetical protein P43SY_011890 [Pythium insidiosum]|uniref:Uncharacterized protein n=1 Tax=Pythium insidiosum TaxID=114742 RepID=A0AAD5Q4I4_PYTIN|nr:hypothetical protein P43SY_011890 [Pythium insidiosum]
MEDLKQATLDSKATIEAIVLIDFKMKLEPLYYREKTVEHYGKRGMTWHGALVQYFEYQEGQDGFEPEVINQKLYYDHLSTGDK